MFSVNRNNIGSFFTLNLQQLSNLFVITGFIVYIGGGVQLFIMLRGAEGYSTFNGDLPSQIIYFSIYVATFIFIILSKQRISLKQVTTFSFGSCCFGLVCQLFGLVQYG